MIAGALMVSTQEMKKPPTSSKTNLTEYVLKKTISFLMMTVILEKQKQSIEAQEKY